MIRIRKSDGTRLSIRKNGALYIARLFNSIYKAIVSTFKQRVVADAGTFEAETHLENKLGMFTQNLFNEASYIISPNGYKTSKIYALKPDNGSGDLTVVRATTATRVDENGNIVDVPANIARIDYSDGEPAILVEPQMTNLWINNNNINGYSSNTYAVRGSVESNAFGSGKDGISYNFLSGSTFVSVSYNIKTIDARSLPIIRLCLLIKNPSSDFFSINFSYVALNTYQFSTLKVYNENTGTIIKLNSNTYALYLYTNAATGAQYSQVRISFVNGLNSNPTPISGTAIIGLGFYQGIASGTLPNTFSPIITSGSAVTRNADIISKSGLSGITTITETFENGTTNVISGSPTSYTMSKGRIKKVIGI